MFYNIKRRETFNFKLILYTLLCTGNSKVINDIKVCLCYQFHNLALNWKLH